MSTTQKTINPETLLPYDLDDFVKYQIEKRNIIILEISEPTQVASFKIERTLLRKFDTIIELKKNKKYITRSKLLREIIKKIVEYCEKHNYCEDINEIPLVIRF